MRRPRPALNLVEGTGVGKRRPYIGLPGHCRWALERRHEIHVGDEVLPLAPPEYVIIRKLEYYREGGSEKHLLDIRSMLEAPAVPFDTAELERQLVARNLQEAWRRAQA